MREYWLINPDGETENYFRLDDDNASAMDAAAFPAGYTLTTERPAPPALPDEPVPVSVTNFQARAAMDAVPMGDGSLFDAVDAALRAGKDTPAGKMAWQAWEQANDFYRNGPLLNTLAAAFGLADAQIDDLFRAAALIEA